MVWLVQNCRSIKCLQFLKPPELRRGASFPWASYQGSAYDPLRYIKRSPDPSPTHAPRNHKSWIRPGTYIKSLTKVSHIYIYNDSNQSLYKVSKFRHSGKIRLISIGNLRKKKQFWTEITNLHPSLNRFSCVFK